MTDMQMITVPALLQGYPGVAFGGYVAGVLAGRAALPELSTAFEQGRPRPAVRVDFRRPVPTGAPVRLAQTADGGSELTDGETLLAVAGPAEQSTEVPDTPSWEEASAAAKAYRAAPPEGVVDCFGCGLDRTPDTGLRQHCGRVQGRDLVATAWIPGPQLADTDGMLPPALVWGALDCPGFAAGRLLGSQRPGAVTASLTASLLRPVRVGEELVTYAWMLGEEGRKHRMGVALASASGELRAVASSLWVDPR
ncbi:MULTISPECIES: hotdog fold domain-containing protein [unclassified Streptomyces]|uniref:hotdog fold domain-containing protein n=1 Tax=unclassified Streptomyces TaxID=2593676 RepID=UPI0038131C21